MNLDEKIKLLIQTRIAGLKSHESKKFIERKPFYLKQQQEKDLQEIQKKLKELESIHLKVEEKIKKLKKLVPDITEQTVICAIYLIYGKILQTWKAIFLLAKEGYGFEIMELNRSIIENLDLISLFFLDKNSTNLEKWFNGEIITNRVARELIHEYITNNPVDTHGLSPYDMANDVYRGFSKYTHCSYVALLETVDIFNEDFDWNKYAGSHYSLKNIRALETTMTSMLVTLKQTYLELKDLKNHDEVDKILNKFAGPVDEQSLKDLIPRIKE